MCCWLSVICWFWGVDYALICSVQYSASSSPVMDGGPPQKCPMAASSGAMIFLLIPRQALECNLVDLVSVGLAGWLAGSRCWVARDVLMRSQMSKGMCFVMQNERLMMMRFSVREQKCDGCGLHGRRSETRNRVDATRGNARAVTYTKQQQNTRTRIPATQLYKGACSAARPRTGGRSPNGQPRIHPSIHRSRIALDGTVYWWFAKNCQTSH